MAEPHTEFTCEVYLRAAGEEAARVGRWLNTQYWGTPTAPLHVRATEEHADAAAKMRRGIPVLVRCRLSRDGTITPMDLVAPPAESGGSPSHVDANGSPVGDALPIPSRPPDGFTCAEFADFMERVLRGEWKP